MGALAHGLPIRRPPQGNSSTRRRPAANRAKATRIQTDARIPFGLACGKIKSKSAPPLAPQRQGARAQFQSHSHFTFTLTFAFAFTFTFTFTFLFTFPEESNQNAPLSAPRRRGARGQPRSPRCPRCGQMENDTMKLRPNGQPRSPRCPRCGRNGRNDPIFRYYPREQKRGAFFV